MTVLLEICVDNPAGLRAAIAGGADRIELCAALPLGGLTPSVGMMRLAAGCGVPVRAMIRPRAGDFHFDEDEVRAMIADIHLARDTGLNGVVIGAATAEGALDRATLERLVAAAAGLDTTLHRVVDLAPDMMASVEIAMALGIDTILTSGGSTTAQAGAATISAMVDAAGEGVTIMPGAGIRAENAAALVSRTGARAVHASCARGIAAKDSRAVALGFSAADEMHTDLEAVRALRGVLDHMMIGPAI